MTDDTSALFYLSTYKYSLYPPQLAAEDVLLWCKMLRQEEVNLPFYLVNDFGALLSGINYELSSSRYTNEKQIYIEMLETVTQLINERLNNQKLPALVIGNLLIKIFFDIKFSLYPVIPHEDLLAQHLNAYYNKGKDIFRSQMTILTKYYPNKAYDNEKAWSQIIERINQIPAPDLIAATAIGTGTTFNIQKSSKLISELIQLPQGASLLSLIMRLLPMINLSTKGAGSQNYMLGGYNDIARKGNLHDLLSSELIYPEDEFLRRFIEGELLYYKREAPPQPRHRKIYTIIDVGPYNWGARRLIAIAGVIALSIYAERHGDQCIIVLREDEEIIMRELKLAHDLNWLLAYRSWELSPLNIIRQLKFTSNNKEDNLLFLIMPEDIETEIKSALFFSLVSSSGTIDEIFALWCQEDQASFAQWNNIKAQFILKKSISIPRETLLNIIGISTATKPSNTITKNNQLSNCQILLRIGHIGKILIMAVSDDGDYLFTTGEDNTLRLWHGTSSALIWFDIVENETPTIASFSPITNMIAIGYADGKIVIRETPSRNTITTFSLNKYIRQLAFSQNEKYLAIVLDNEVQIRQAPYNEPPFQHSIMINQVSQVAFFNDDENLIIVSGDFLVHLFSIDKLRSGPITTFSLHRAKEAILIADQLIVYCRSEVIVYEHNINKDWQVTDTFLLPDDWPGRGDSWLDPLGETVLTKIYHDSLDWYDFRNQKTIRIFRYPAVDAGNSQTIDKFVIAKDSKLIYTAMSDGTIDVKRMINGELLWRMPAEPKRLVRLSANLTATKIAISDERSGNFVWQLDDHISANFTPVPNIDMQEIEYISISPDGEIFALANKTGAWSLFNSRLQKRILLSSRNNVVATFALSKYFAVINTEHHLEIYDTQKGTKIYWSNAIPNKYFFSAVEGYFAFLPDVNYVAVYDIAKAEIVYRLKIDKLLALRLSDDGKLLHLLTVQGNFETWSVGGDRIFSQIIDLRSHTRAKIFDAATLVLYGRDNNVIILQRTAGKELMLTGHIGGVLDCIATNKLFITADRAGRVRLFARDNGELLLTLYLVYRDQWVAYRGDAAYQCATGKLALLNIIPFPITDITKSREDLIKGEAEIIKFLKDYQ